MTTNKIILLAGAGALALAGCTDPYSGERSNTRTGALTGAVIGSAVGAATGGRDRLGRTIIGGAIGAAAGGVLGAQLDQQARDLRRDIGNDRIAIQNTGSELVVTMPQDILFATDSAAVRPDLQRDLRAMADNLQNYSDSRVEVIGHTDSTGPADYNLRLSQRRADSVANVLVGAGVASWRIDAFGRGEDEPVATNLTAEGRTQNRRVEIIIRPTRT